MRRYGAAWAVPHLRPLGHIPVLLSLVSPGARARRSRENAAHRLRAYVENAAIAPSPSRRRAGAPSRRSPRGHQSRRLEDGPLAPGFAEPPWPPETPLCGSPEERSPGQRPAGGRRPRHWAPTGPPVASRDAISQPDLGLLARPTPESSRPPTGGEDWRAQPKCGVHQVPHSWLSQPRGPWTGAQTRRLRPSRGPHPSSGNSLAQTPSSAPHPRHCPWDTGSNRPANPL